MFNFLLKEALFNFAYENNAGKAVKTLKSSKSILLALIFMIYTVTGFGTT